MDDQSTYFDISEPVLYMSVIAHVKDEWAARIPAVTHVDQTVRLQSVTKNSNPFLWELLRYFRNLTGIGVLLNTSFNTQDKPMITTLADALRILDETELDAVYSEGWLFTKM